MRFFAVAMATDEPIELKLKRALFEAKFNRATKFGQDRLVRLCSRAVRKSNGTDRHTDRQTEIVKIRLTKVRRFSRFADGPVTQQTHTQTSRK